MNKPYAIRPKIWVLTRAFLRTSLIFLLPDLSLNNACTSKKVRLLNTPFAARTIISRSSVSTRIRHLIVTSMSAFSICICFLSFTIVAAILSTIVPILLSLVTLFSLIISPPSSLNICIALRILWSQTKNSFSKVSRKIGCLDISF